MLALPADPPWGVFFSIGPGPSPANSSKFSVDMRVSAKADYAIRATVELAAAEGSGQLRADRIAEAQDIPIKFLESILLELKHAGIVRSQRGAEGGYALARPGSDISLADVIRAVDGPLANVRGDRPEKTIWPWPTSRRSASSRGSCAQTRTPSRASSSTRTSKPR